MGGGNLHRTPAAGVSRSVRSYALALCMAFAIAAVPVQAQVKNITLKASNTPVSTVMQQIEEQSQQLAEKDLKIMKMQAQIEELKKLAENR